MEIIREVLPTEVVTPPSNLPQEAPIDASDGIRMLTPGADRSGVGRVHKDLERLGPDQILPVFGLDEAFGYCQRLAAEHYENFSVATRLAPQAIRPHLFSIYAFCRWSDDLADESGNQERAQSLLAWWRRELDACFAGQASHPVFRALRHSIAVHSLPKEPFVDLLSAFVQDQTTTRFESDLQLLDYCQRSANPVGRLVLQLAGATTPDAVQLSDSICTGLQLANFCQDIRVDARRGRIYLPQSRMERFRVQEGMLIDEHPHEEVRHALESWAEESRGYLLRGLPLVRLGPRWFARSVQLFVRGGLTLLANMESRGFDVWAKPITVSRKQKLGLMLNALFQPRSVSTKNPPSRLSR